MAVFHEMTAGANDNIHTIHARAHRQLGVAHVTAHMCQNLGLEAELGYRFTILSALLTRGGRCELDVVHAKLIQSLGNLDLGLGVEEGGGKLLPFSQCRLDNLEV